MFYYTRTDNTYAIITPERDALVTKKNELGFTAIELLISISMIGIIVPSIIGLITTINRLNDRANDMNTINSLVENKVESLRSIGFTGLENGTTNFTNELPPGIDSPRSATYTISSPHQPDIKQIDILIDYTDQGRPQSVSYKTYVGELGVGQY